MTVQPAIAPPIVNYLYRDTHGQPMLVGSRCGPCGQIVVGTRNVCAKCGARGSMETVRLSEKGKLYAYSIVYRSFPGVDTPFIDAVVDLDDGSHIKGTLTGVEPSPDAIEFDMPVRVAYREAEPSNASGQPHLTYYFVPA